MLGSQSRARRDPSPLAPASRESPEKSGTESSRFLVGSGQNSRMTVREQLLKKICVALPHGGTSRIGQSALNDLFERYVEAGLVRAAHEGGGRCR